MSEPTAVPRVPTLYDVAKAAGVSLATASKALNGRHDVSATTRARVENVADGLGFTPNVIAQSLVANRSRTVGLLTSDLVGRFVLPVLMGAEDAFGAGKVDVFLFDARGDALREQHHLRAMLSRRVDGIIVVGSRTDPRPSLGSQVPVPVVCAYAPSDDPADVSFAPDNAAAGSTALQHLVSLGKSRIVHISGDPNYAAARDRADGIRAAAADAGVELLDPPMFAEWSEHWGRDSTALLLERHPHIDGIIAGSDQIARGALDMLHEIGKAVPDEVAVVSFDNWEVLATQSRPTLSSVDFNLQDLGRAAARSIFETIEGRPSDGGIRYFPTRLVIRGSTVRRR